MVFIDACLRKETPYTPIWMMRQAGRYLTEYMNTRAQAGSFMNLCHNPELACEVTLQPIDILGVDAAILFSDILVVPDEMGMNLEFIKGQGPIIHDPLRTQADLDRLSDQSPDNLGYVYDSVKLIRKELSSDKALIGFAGSPWTLATYMVEGGGSKSYAIIKKMVYSNPTLMHNILRKTTDAVIEYLSRQIEAGADAVQVFDSWGGALEKSAFFEFSWSYMQEISNTLKTRYPNTPVILFSRGITGMLDEIDGNFDVFGVDWNMPIEIAKAKLGSKYVLQGNLEPTRLYDAAKMEEGVRHIVDVMGKEPGHIFNLGHGMLPDLPRENAIRLVELVHELTRR